MTYAGQLQTRSPLEPGARLGQLRSRLAGRIQMGVWSASTRYGLRRDLDRPLEKPNAKIPIQVRPLVDADMPLLFSVGDNGANSLQERIEIARRQSFVAKGARRGFVAVDARNNTPCYVQWLFGPADNGFIRRIGGFPALKPHEALLENAYTPAAYRGLGIMSEAMALIAERAVDFNARHVLTFVDWQNIASLKGCQRAGFHPHLLHRWSRVGFGLIKSDTFEVLPETDPRRTMKF